jgi:hypothetical protein
VVLLYLAPGYRDDDLRLATDRQFQRHYGKRRDGRQLLPASDEPPWTDWFERRTACFGTFEELRSKVAVLDIAPYHAATFRDWPLLTALPSCRASVTWAQRVLFQRAIEGEIAVVCLRAARHWGLTEGRRVGKALFAPQVARSGYMRRTRMRDQIIRKVRTILGAET